MELWYYLAMSWWPAARGSSLVPPGHTSPHGWFPDITGTSAWKALGQPRDQWPAHIFQVTASMWVNTNSPTPSPNISRSFLVSLVSVFSWLSSKSRANCIGSLPVHFTISAGGSPPVSYHLWPEIVENVSHLSVSFNHSLQRGLIWYSHPFWGFFPPVCYVLGYLLSDLNYPREFFPPPHTQT